MSFREKTAWITLCAILIVSLMYWLHVPSLREPHPGGFVLHAMHGSISAFIVIEIVAWIVLRLRYPKDARTPKDEREKLIDLKSMRIAYYVLASCSILGVAMALHLAGAGPV